MKMKDPLGSANEFLYRIMIDTPYLIFFKYLKIFFFIDNHYETQSEFSEVLAGRCESILLNIHWMFGGALSRVCLPKEFCGEFPTRIDLILKFITFVYFLCPVILFHKMAVNILYWTRHNFVGKAYQDVHFSQFFLFCFFFCFSNLGLAGSYWMWCIFITCQLEKTRIHWAKLTLCRISACLRLMPWHWDPRTDEMRIQI